MYFKDNIGYIGVKGEPNTQYELLRRRIYSNTNEIWYFIHAKLMDIHKKATELAPEMVESINYVLEMTQEHKRLIFILLCYTIFKTLYFKRIWGLSLI